MTPDWHGYWMAPDGTALKQIGDSQGLIPDRINLIVGWRMWRLANGAVWSINIDHVRWPVREVLIARCWMRIWVDKRLDKTDVGWAVMPHAAPQHSCGCGIYAGVRELLAEYAQTGYVFQDTEHPVIFGEVSLWGMVVEHQRGWRAQIAYPRSFRVPDEWTEDKYSGLTEYGVPIYGFPSDQLLREGMI